MPTAPLSPESSAHWQIWIDTGGTFTDCLALGPDDTLHRAKVLSSSALRGSVREVLNPRTLRIDHSWGHAPDDLVRGYPFRRLGAGSGDPVYVAGYDAQHGVLTLSAPLDLTAGDAFEIVSPEEAPVLAARLVTGTPAGEPLPPLSMRLATTRGTNALLERHGAETALFVTRGFGDLLRIGTQQRPDLFALDIRKAEPLYERSVEVPERIASDGSLVRPLELELLEEEVLRLLQNGVRVAAVALLNAYRNPEHERALRDYLLRAGFAHVSCSSDLSSSIKLLPRAETALVDAYLTPVIADYLAGVESEVRGSLHVMTSAGGLVRPANFRAKDSLLSGPAGGVVGAARAGRRSGHSRVIAFDMGGTSTDVARYDGDFEYVWQHEVGGAQLLAPALAIESVAAGGGSICSLDANGLRVGPESAGASPGPACYGAGGPLTITDVNLLLGRLDPDRFGIPLSRAAAEEALETLRRDVEARDGQEVAAEPLLDGLLQIANERMADAIRRISLRKGYDPAEYALVAFGGAGAQHGCGVAKRLGMRAVIVPPDAGLLSALGIGHAVLERFAERQVLGALDEMEEGALRAWLEELEAEAVAAVAREGVPQNDVEIRRRIANLRYVGQESTLAVEVKAAETLREAFEARYTEIFGHRPESRPVELESLRVIASSRGEEETLPEPAADYEPSPVGSARAWLAGGWRDVPAYDRMELRPGARLAGPALVWERHSATVVESGWTVSVDASGALLLTEERHPGPGQPAKAPGAERASEAERVEAVQEELFTRRYQALVEEMGEQLRRTALSTNVKERLDFSCALLNSEGELVVNAPHIPVHLGALGLCVRRIRDTLALRPGDVVVTNHPGFGGSHLPDVTVITPVFDDEARLLGYVASRAHHAEIGGTRPGSMPPAARSLAEEGVVIPPTYLVERGQERWERVRELLTGGPHPSRAVEDNLADLRAQVAANHRGAELLCALARKHGRDVIHRFMAALADRAELRVREALSRLPASSFSAREQLDDGSPLQVSVTLTSTRAVIDFDGSGPVHPGNLNATPAIVRSVVLYVLRLLIDEPLPLNEGLMRAVDLRIPPGLLNPSFPDDPAQAPAVVGGNTEVSQRLVDTLLKAFELSACGQGTMNNLLWGSDRFGYYETVCGGAGAGPEWHGASGVHTHMTNTRITDAEVLEHRYPVRVERFAIRAGSGGAGRWRGGDGVVRELVFEAPMSLSVLTQHRVERPYGVRGGEPGLPGRQRVFRASGEVVELGPVDGCEVSSGDRLVLETPGGGGWGRPAEGEVEASSTPEEA